MTKTWKDIPEYEGIYAISDSGEVKRLCDASLGAVKAGRVLKPRPLKTGYLRINLCKNGTIKDFLIHRLVLITFVSPPPFEKAQVNHINGNKSDNRIENLEWVTQSQNVQHSYDQLGHHGRGETNHMTHFTKQDVLKIREMARGGMGYAAISKNFDVTDSAIKKIVLGKSWGHI